MGLSFLSSAPLLIALLVSGCGFVNSATVTYDFNIAWTTANPDGKFQRRTMGINNQWPPPTIHVNKGDRLIVNAFNGLGVEQTSLHFHGIFQNGTNYMDGPSKVTQCPIAPGQSFTYDFIVDQPGTYWYHSHFRGQYPDGLRGALVVHDPDGPYQGQYDEEIVLTLSDWYHKSMSTLSARFISPTNPTGAEPVPDSALMNDSQDITLAVKPGKTYLVRIINMAAFAAQYLWFEDHNMRVVEVDGVYTKPMEAERLYLTTAQRVSILLTMKNDTSQNYAFVGSMDEDLFDKVPPGLNPNVTGWLVYDSAKPNPQPRPIDNFDHLDDVLLEPYDDFKLLQHPDYSITLNVSMDNLGDGANYAFFNNITYVQPKIPTLYTALQAPSDLVTNPKIYGTYTNPFVYGHNQVIEIVVNNLDSGKHPFHLHGHNFQVVYRSEEESGAYDSSVSHEMPQIPMRRDTVLVRPQGSMVLRFVADNPGVWLFHCHIEWHMESGLSATFIEAPIEMRERVKVPDSHYQQCKGAGLKFQGNAAGNTQDYLDLAGENQPPKPLPTGFTTRGIIALVFSAISGILGSGVIVWYGLKETSA